MNSLHSEGRNQAAPIGQVGAVSRSGAHQFSKPPQPSVRLLAGLGVEGDAHSGVRVQHRSRVAADPSQPNLRQVHLLHGELFEELAAQGFGISAGQLGENVTTLGLNLLALPVGTRLHLGGEAVVEITGLRNPCAQIERFGSAQRRSKSGRRHCGGVAAAAVDKAGLGLICLSPAGGETQNSQEREAPPPVSPIPQISS